MTDATVPRRSDIYLFASVLPYLDDALMTQAFQQIRPQQTQGGGGSGMGLWICREASSLCHRTNDQMDIIHKQDIDRSEASIGSFLFRLKPILPNRFGSVQFGLRGLARLASPLRTPSRARVSPGVTRGVTSRSS